MTSKFSGWLAAAALLLNAHGVSVAYASAGDVVRIAVDVPYAPMEYRTPAGRLTGFDIDLGNALCQQARLHCVWVVQPWAGMVPGLLARKFDAVMSTMAVTQRREHVVHFTDPYMTLDSAWFTRFVPSAHGVQPQDLAGKRIGVQRGTIQDAYVTDHYASKATIRRYAGADDIATDMAVGRLDAVFITAITGQQIFPHAGASRSATIHRSAPSQAFGQPIAIAVRPQNEALRKTLNKALRQLRADGRYAQIRSRYFHP